MGNEQFWIAGKEESCQPGTGTSWRPFSLGVEDSHSKKPELACLENTSLVIIKSASSMIMTIGFSSHPNFAKKNKGGSWWAWCVCVSVEQFSTLSDCCLFRYGYEIYAFWHVLLQVYYNFNPIFMLAEPLMLASVFFFLFVACVAYLHIDLSIRKWKK